MESITIDTEVREDIFETVEEASLIINRADDLRLFLNDTSRQSREAIEIVRLASEWVKTVKSGFNSYTPGEALLIVDHYDLMHRIAFRLPADKGVLNRIILRHLMHGFMVTRVLMNTYYIRLWNVASGNVKKRFSTNR